MVRYRRSFGSLMIVFSIAWLQACGEGGGGGTSTGETDTDSGDTKSGAARAAVSKFGGGGNAPFFIR